MVEKQTLSAKTTKLIFKLIIIFGMATMILPYLWMFLTSFKTAEEAFLLIPTWLPQKWQFQNYKIIFKNFHFLTAIKNTLIIEVLVITIGTFVSTLAAFSFAKLRMPYKKTILLILLSSMMIPYATVMLPQYRAFQSLGLVDTLWPLILPGFFGNVAMIFFVMQYMRGIPSALIENAKVEGASYFQMFFKIILPLSKPAIAAQVIFWFVGIWNDYFAPSIYLTKPKVHTLQVLVYSLSSTYESGTNLPLVMTGAFISSLPMILIFVVFQKFFINMSMMVGVKE